MSKRRDALLLVAIVTFAWPAAAAERSNDLTVDDTTTGKWNVFVERLVRVHEHLIKTHNVATEERSGGYSGLPEFYRQVSYLDRETGLLLSRIRFEQAAPETIHTIEVFFYGQDGRLLRDYSARYLPGFRNAPIQTLVSLHGYDSDLSAFRQFDASGAWIYERCSGTWFGKVVDISNEMPDVGTSPSLAASEEYVACFGMVPFRAGAHLNPVSGIPGFRSAETAAEPSLDLADQLRERIAVHTSRLRLTPRDAAAYIKRGEAYFEALEFAKAVDDFSKAISLDAGLDQAFFGRGLALGRQGRIDEGIADLSVFISRNPESSLAYTKRGVRYLWKREFELAEADLMRAIELDPANAEAHDDLGVALAHRGEYAAAELHFKKTISVDKTYQKAYHNLALVWHLQGRNGEALEVVEAGLRLVGRYATRSSMQLKANILAALGRVDEAAAAEKQASTLVDLNWSEQLSAE
ncbi:MAG: tetratricopeptide repeat protein [Alphaproteobacteria bacterium]|nr:tetratricopeptide repeat protein [Alphaproteobacteria bacterium]